MTYTYIVKINMYTSFFGQKEKNTHIQTFYQILSQSPWSTDNIPIKNIIDHIIASVRVDPTFRDIWDDIDKIHVLMEHIQPWTSLSKPRLALAREHLQSYILSQIYPIWITSQIINEDQLFYDRIVRLSPLMKPESVGITLPDSVLFDNAVTELKELDAHLPDAPTQILYRLYECYNSLVVAVRRCQNVPDGSDGLLPTLILTIIRACPHHLISTCHWIEQWCDPTISRSGELFCILTNIIGAITYIYSLEPESKLIRINVNDKCPPDIILSRLSIDEYNTIIDPIRTTIHNFSDSYLTEIEERAKAQELVPPLVPSLHHLLLYYVVS